MKILTPEQYMDSMLSNIANYPTLIGLDTMKITSDQTLLDTIYGQNDVSEWINYIRIFAEEAYNLQTVIQGGITDLQNIIVTRGNSFNPQQIQQLVLNYQDGYNIIIDSTTNNVPAYQTIDNSAKIIKSCAVEVNGEKVLIKIAPLLDMNQRSRFNSFLNEVNPTALLTVKNNPPDNLKILGTVFYDGQRNVTDIQTEVEKAINNYISNISFDSYFYNNFLIDAIQSVNGVFNVNITGIEWKRYDEQNFTKIIFTDNNNVKTEYNQNIRSDAGYFIISPDFSLSNTLNYKIK